MGDIHRTQFFNPSQENKMEAGEILAKVYAALTEKGYNRRLYHVGGSHLYYQPSERKEPDHEA